MDMKHRIDAAIDAALVNRIVGCTVLVHRDGKEVYARTAGLADRETGRKLERNTIWRLASVTKPIVATAALRMMELGLLSLEDQVTKYLPWFTPPSPDGVVRPISLRQLLSHSSGLSYAAVPEDVSPGMSGPIIPLEENLRRLARAPLVFAPGTGWVYGMSIDVVGCILSSIDGSTVQAALDKYVLGPLGMTETRFTAVDPARLPAQYANTKPPLPPVVPPALITEDNKQGTNFSVSRILRSDAPQSGGGGLSGTADDVKKMLEVYAGSGTLLKPATVAEALRNQIGTLPRREEDLGKRFCLLGALMDNPKAINSPCPPGSVDWGGAWGHNWIIDPVNRLTVLTCTNVAPEGDNGPFRQDIRDAVYAGLSDR